MAMASSLDQVGPITKTVEDAAIILQILAGNDPHDATSTMEVIPNYLKEIKKGVKGLTIGLPDDYLFVSQKEVREKILEATKVLEKLGAKIKKIHLFDIKYTVAVYTILQRAEVSSNLGRYDGIRFGKDRNYFGEEAKRRIMLGTYTLSSGYYDAYYLKAQKVRTLICQDFKKAFDNVDLIIGPTSPSTALPIGSSKNHSMFGEISDMLAEPSTIAGLPGVSLNCGFSKENLPVGLQVIGPQFSEELLFQAAYAYEQETQWRKIKPKI